MNNLIGKITLAQCPHCQTGRAHEILSLRHEDDVEEFLYPTLKCLSCQRALGHRDLDESMLFDGVLAYETRIHCPNVSIRINDSGHWFNRLGPLLRIHNRDLTTQLWPSEQGSAIRLAELLDVQIYKLQELTAIVDPLIIWISQSRFTLNGIITVPDMYCRQQILMTILAIERVGRGLAASLDNHHYLHLTYTQTLITENIHA